MTKKYLFLFAIVTLIPSAAICAMQHLIGVVPQLFNIDFFLIYILMPLIQKLFGGKARYIISLLISVTGLVILLWSIGFIYIGDPALIINYITFINEWPWRNLVVVLVGSICLSIPYFIYSRGSKAYSIDLRLGLFSLVAVLAIDARLDSKNLNVATSSAYQIANMSWQWINTPKFTILENTERSAKQYIQKNINNNDSILLIVVESWGLAKFDRINSDILKPFIDALEAKYSIKVSQTLADNGTFTGELRELCGLRTKGLPNKAYVMTKLVDQCLPSGLARLGFSTWAGHANFGTFYNRSELYPALGFVNTQFKGMTSKAQKACENNIFGGYCDDMILESALNHIAANKRSFSYVMTLETHLPLRETPRSTDICSEDYLCTYKIRMSDALASIASTIVRSNIYPDIIILTGDHSPPYILKSARANFFEGSVPWVVLTKR